MVRKSNFFISFSAKTFHWMISVGQTILESEAMEKDNSL